MYVEHIFCAHCRPTCLSCCPANAICINAVMTFLLCQMIGHLSLDVCVIFIRFFLSLTLFFFSFPHVFISGSGFFLTPPQLISVWTDRHHRPFTSTGHSAIRSSNGVMNKWDSRRIYIYLIWYLEVICHIFQNAFAADRVTRRWMASRDGHWCQVNAGSHAI